MKVTLRNKRTGSYLTQRGTWVASGLQARDFGKTEAAEEYHAELTVADVDIFYIFDDPRLNHWSHRQRNGDTRAA